MARSSIGTDALIEILSLCEQTLIALDPQPDIKHILRTDRSPMRVGPPLVLIRGGLASDTGVATGSASSD